MGTSRADALQQASRGFEHRGAHYTIEKLEARQWKVIDAKGRNLGTLQQRSDDGEGGDPVFAVYRPVSDQIYMEGSDWESLVQALINETEAS
jgi:hypothetical protein